jgi:hypothetical protein
VAEASVNTRDNYVYLYQKVAITKDEEKYPAFVPEADCQEVHFETDKRFARIEKQNTAKAKVEKTIKSNFSETKSKLIQSDTDNRGEKRKKV